MWERLTAFWILTLKRGALKHQKISCTGGVELGLQPTIFLKILFISIYLHTYPPISVSMYIAKTETKQQQQQNIIEVNQTQSITSHFIQMIQPWGLRMIVSQRLTILYFSFFFFLVVFETGFCCVTHPGLQFTM